MIIGTEDYHDCYDVSFLNLIECVLISAGSLIVYDGNPHCNSTASSLRGIFHLTSCIAFQAEPNGIISGVVALDIPRQAFRYIVAGIGIECNPVRGLIVSVRSPRGRIYICKAYTGNEVSDLSRCRYRCSCPDGCAFVIVQSYKNTTMQSLCKLSIY